LNVAPPDGFLPMPAEVHEAVKRRTFHVSSMDLRQTFAWLFAARSLGLSVPKYLARAGDIYARHLAWVKTRREDKAGREMERSLHEARRKR
jgi:hypothetical protein